VSYSLIQRAPKVRCRGPFMSPQPTLRFAMIRNMVSLS
jgi:hypothetical protein